MELIFRLLYPIVKVYHLEDERAPKLGMFWLVALLIGFSLSLMWDGKEVFMI